jgi:catechol 2,3-dioxygenase-like lactoylglutathione lyase family enzyme
MFRVQLALRVADLDASVAFYSKLFGAEPAKRRPGYANFAVTEPPLKLVLIEGQPGEPTRMDHLGVEVETPGEVTAATARLAAQGLPVTTEEGTACCYAVQAGTRARYSRPNGRQADKRNHGGSAATSGCGRRSLSSKPRPGTVRIGASAVPERAAGHSGTGSRRSQAPPVPGRYGTGWLRQRAAPSRLSAATIGQAAG